MRENTVPNHEIALTGGIEKSQCPQEKKGVLRVGSRLEKRSRERGEEKGGRDIEWGGKGVPEGRGEKLSERRGGWAGWVIEGKRELRKRLGLKEVSSIPKRGDRLPSQRRARGKKKEGSISPKGSMRKRRERGPRGVSLFSAREKSGILSIWGFSGGERKKKKSLKVCERQ